MDGFVLIVFQGTQGYTRADDSGGCVCGPFGIRGTVCAMLGIPHPDGPGPPKKPRASPQNSPD